MDSPTFSFSIESADVPTAKLLARVEKLCVLELWTTKAKDFLYHYIVLLDQTSSATDPVERGKLIRDCESHFLSAVNFFFRCFHDQPSTYLKIKNVTNDERLIAYYHKLKTLRDDEFVHWKGVRSSVAVKYVFNQVSSKGMSFTGQIEVELADSIGPDQDAGTFFELIDAVMKSVDQMKRKSIGDLMSQLQKPDVFAASKLSPGALR